MASNEVRKAWGPRRRAWSKKERKGYAATLRCVGMTEDGKYILDDDEGGEWKLTAQGVVFMFGSVAAIGHWPQNNGGKDADTQVVDLVK